jgi:hypothetical protein
MHKGILCGMASFNQHCRLGFWHPLFREKLDTRLSEATGNFGHIAGLADLPGEGDFKALVIIAAELNESGAKPKRETKRRTRIAVPGDFAAALLENKRAYANFDAFSYSHRKEYVQWITAAKREETRRRRIAAAVKQIAAGKSQNWKYEK